MNIHTSSYFTPAMIHLKSQYYKHTKLNCPLLIYFSYYLLYRVWRQAGFFLYLIFFPLASTLLMYKKKKKLEHYFYCYMMK